MNEYAEQKYVKWGNTRSACFTITSGIKQGLVISSHLFTINTGFLSKRLTDSGIGYHFDST